MLCRKRSEEHIQSSNESTKTRTKTKKKTKRSNDTKHMPGKGRRALDRESLIYRQPQAIRYPPPRNRNNFAFVSKSIAYTTPYSQGFRLLYRHSRRRLGIPGVGPINTALKRLKLTTATPGATSTLSASSASLSLCRCSDAFHSSFTHSVINLQPPSRIVLYQTPGSSTGVLYIVSESAWWLYRKAQGRIFTLLMGCVAISTIYMSVRVRVITCN